MLTDSELIRACAEKVMGWPGHFRRHSWNPLASDADAFMLVDRIREIIPKQTATQTYSFQLCQTGIPGDWMCSFTVNEFDFSHQALADGVADRRRAIVLACLKAMGVECQ